MKGPMPSYGASSTADWKQVPILVIAGSQVMPTYVYECAECGEFEQQQSIKEPALTRCPKCGGEVRRLIAGGTSFILKGGGWSKSSCADGSCCLPSSSRRGR